MHKRQRQERKGRDKGEYIKSTKAHLEAGRQDCGPPRCLGEHHGGRPARAWEGEGVCGVGGSRRAHGSEGCDGTEEGLLGQQSRGATEGGNHFRINGSKWIRAIIVK